MTKDQLQKQIDDLMTHKRTGIIEIKTKEHIRRGLFQGIQPEGCFLFLWIPGIAPEVKSIENLHMKVVGIITRYEANEILSIK